MKVVHVGHGHIPFLDKEIVGHENRRHGAKEDGVASKKGDKGLRGSENLPRDKCPAPDKGSEQLAPTDVDVLWRKRHEVIGSADGVCGDVDAESNDDQSNGTKCSGGTSAMGARLHPHPIISIGFHMTLPYADSAAAAVKMPSRPTIALKYVRVFSLYNWKLLEDSLKMHGMTMAWMFGALGLLAYLEKSAMFRPRVA